MLLKRILTALFVFAAWGTGALAQQSGSGTVTIISEPPGAQVRLQGETEVTGVTPVQVRFPLAGRYRLSVTHTGYETYRTDLILDPSREMVVNVSLVAKTRFKAAMRSLFIPGWGQYYSGQKTRGLAFTLIAAASVAGYFVADNDFDKKLSRFNSRLDAFDRAEQSGASFDRLDALKSDLDRAQSDAFDAETVRRVSIGTVVGAWGLSVLDALLLFPEERGTFVVKGIAVKPDYSTDRVGVTLSKSF